jgi:hypothetical protein
MGRDWSAVLKAAALMRPWHFDPEFQGDDGIELYETDLAQRSGTLTFGGLVGIYRPAGWKVGDLGMARPIWLPAKAA